MTSPFHQARTQLGEAERVHRIIAASNESEAAAQRYRDEITDAIDSGISYRRLARLVGCDHSNIHQIVKKVRAARGGAA